MKLRPALGAAVGTAGLAVAGNRLLARRAGRLENPLSGDDGTYRWRGMDVAYAAAGDEEDPDVVLVHGVYAAASGYEFEPVFERLAENYRVIAVDLPGFGRSDRPPLVYSPTLYAEFLADFATDVADAPVVVASSLSGAYAAMAAEDGEGDDSSSDRETDGSDAEAPFERLVLVCPTAETAPERPWLRTLVRSPVIGTTLYNALASKPSIRWFLTRDGYYDPDNVDPAEISYAWRSAHQPGARFAPASFVAGELDPEEDLETLLSDLPVPVTLVWGRDAELVPLRDGRRLAETADLDLVVVDYATQLPHAEHPERFAEYLEAELPRSGLGRRE